MYFDRPIVAVGRSCYASDASTDGWQAQSLVVHHRLLYSLILLHALAQSLVVQLRLLSEHPLRHPLVDLVYLLLPPASNTSVLLPGRVKV